jgi:hypothetical protein
MKYVYRFENLKFTNKNQQWFVFWMAHKCLLQLNNNTNNNTINQKFLKVKESLPIYAKKLNNKTVRFICTWSYLNACQKMICIRLS